MPPYLLDEPNAPLRYKALQPGEIRLLVIRPNHHQFNGPIHCSLQHQPLEDAVYEALSYVWGDPEPMRTIIVDDQIINVTLNLFHAIRQLRRPDTPVIFWIDALCINQSDNLEKTQQVGRMGEVFSKATAVICWLGKRKIYYELADFVDQPHPGMKLVRDIGDLYSELPADLPAERPLGGSAAAAAWDQMVAYLTDETYKSSWVLLSLLLTNGFWDRVWTLQEIALAKRAILVYGDERAEWTKFDELLTWFRHRAPPNSAAWNVLQNSQLFSKATVCRLRSRNKPGAARSSLLQIMIRYRARQATDARDKIFGFLGLSSHAGPEANYTESVSGVYRNFVRHIIQTEKSLDILSAAVNSAFYLHHLTSMSLEDSGAQKDNFADHIPSWAPDWRLGWGVGHYLLFRHFQSRLYDACGGSQPRVDFEQQFPYRLKVEGVKVDVVSTTSEWTKQRLCEVPNFTRNMWAVLQLEHAVAGEHTKEQAKAAFDRTLSASQGESESGRRRDWKWLQRYGTIGDSSHEAQSTSEDTQDSDDVFAEFMFEDGRTRSILEATTAFTTLNEVVGLAPAATRPGDIVTVLEGGKVPYMLREVNQGGLGGYVLVGPCCEYHYCFFEWMQFEMMTRYLITPVCLRLQWNHGRGGCRASAMRQHFHAHLMD